MVEALDDGVVADRAGVRRDYATMGREIGRLSGMIDDLFELAQIDAGAFRLNVQPVSLVGVVTEIVDAMRAQAMKRGVALSLDAPSPPAALLLDGARIERAVSNLVRNALEHTPRGGNVEVSIDDDRGWTIVRVADTGEGIAPDDCRTSGRDSSGRSALASIRPGRRAARWGWPLRAASSNLTVARSKRRPNRPRHRRHRPVTSRARGTS